jgi:hypothetical protein
MIDQRLQRVEVDFGMSLVMQPTKALVMMRSNTLSQLIPLQLKSLG